MESNPNTNPPTEREKYIANLEDKITKAVRAKRFNETDTGKWINELLQEQSNLIIKKIGGSSFKDDHQGYVYELGALHFAQRILNIINGTANTDVTELKEQLDAAKPTE